MRRPFRGLRARLMAIGVLGLAIALALGSVTLYLTLSYFVNRTLTNEETATAHAVAGLVDQDRLPDPIPATGTQLLQVLDSHNRVVRASVNADRLTALLTPAEVARTSAGHAITVPGTRMGLTSPLRVVTAPAHLAGAPMTVVVAQEYDALDHARSVLRNTLLVTFPLLLAVLALIAWWVIGRTLRPVETLRAGADQVSGTGQEIRLPVPDSADEIQALAITLNSMLDRLAAGRARQRAFVADAAHELRSPIASMRTQLEVAERLGEGSQLTEDLLADITRLTAVVEDLLFLARADAATVSPVGVTTFTVEPLLDGLANSYRSARVPVRFGRAVSTTAYGAPEEVRRLLVNLVDNAVRHATSGVDLAVTIEGPQVLVTVTDDGPGIPAGEREHVFERFTRLDDARDRDAGGSGLGLAIARELARRSGGTLRLTDAHEGGLVAEVRLAREEPAADR